MDAEVMSVAMHILIQQVGQRLGTEARVVPEEGFVRACTITQGRTTSAHDDLTLITVIATVAVAAGLNLPVAVTKILVSGLIALGRVTARPPLVVAAGQGSGHDAFRR